ncbi:hypothetical protein NDU88_005738 [Pleurodeles waltl]|uniref:Uncharacterized protein n=1 Tax=Pleurodeles waltl TaxID=8319 RepID=A0AAV7NPU5_PLEWA|nr:hypothetical protein NDU88_005738 [Pleurodeles waltl]
MTTEKEISAIAKLKLVLGLLTAKRSTPLLEYIKNRKLEKQKIREEKREERRRRELEKKRIREEEKRKRKDDERRKRKESEKQRKLSEKDTQIQLLKKSDRGEESSTEKADEKEESEMDDFKWEKPPASASLKSRQSESCVKDLQEKFQNESDKEQRDTEKRFHEKEPERPKYWLDDGRKHRSNYEFEKFVRRNEEDFKWGKGYNHDRGKKGNHNYSFSMESLDKLGKEDKCDDMASKKERIRNKFNGDKTKLLCCSSNKEPVGLPANFWPVPSGRTIVPADMVRNLVITFDKKLSMESHMYKTVGPCFVLFRALRKILPVLPPSVRALVVLSVILS